MTLDLKQHLKRQIAFSRGTYGPGDRMEGVLNHIEKEIEEVRASKGSPDEWVDLVILALDGLTRSYMCVAGTTVDDAARLSTTAILKKQAKNELRAWPDWRTADSGKAIEHVKTQP